MQKRLKSTFLIYSSVGDWHILHDSGEKVSVSKELDFQSKLSEVKRAFADDPSRQVSSVVLLESGECLCVDSHTHSSKPEQFLFEIEEHLPLDAEQIAVAKNAIRSRFATVVDREKLKQLLDGLESNGVSVQKVMPATLFALQALSVEAKNTTFVVEVIDGIDIVIFDKKGLASWTWHEKSSFSWPQVDHEIRSKNPKVYTNLSVDDDRYPVFVEPLNFSLDTLISQHVKTALRNPWVSFPAKANQFEKPDYRKASAIALIVTLVLMALVANLGLWIAGSRHQSNSNQNIAAQQSILHAVFPGARKRANVEGYLKSRLAKEEKNQVVLEVLGSSGRLDEVVDVISCIRNSGDIDVKKIGYSPGYITLEGTAISNQVLRTLAETVKGKGFDIARRNEEPSSTGQRKSFIWQVSPGEKS